MTGLYRWIVIVTVALAMALLVPRAGGAQEASDEENAPRSADPRTSDEVVPGVTLDGSIIIDEDVWLILIGEPGRHMTDAHAKFKEGDFVESAEAIRKAASFLFVATENASPSQQESVRKAASELNKLSRDVGRRQVKSVDTLSAEFSRAHYAMAQHHAAKSTSALAEQEWEHAGRYLRSSTNHLQRAAYWSGQDLRSETKLTLEESRREAGRLIEQGGKSVEATGKLIETLGKRIERFGKRLVEKQKATEK